MKIISIVLTLLFPAHSGIPCVQELVAPTYVEAIGIGPDNVRVIFVDNNTEENAYEIFWSTSPQGPFELWGATSNVGPDTIVQDLDTQRSTTYYIMVRPVIYPDVFGPFSSVVSATSQADYVAAPSNFSVRQEGNHLRLTWTDNADDEYGFRISRSSDGIHYERPIYLPENTTEYKDKDVIAGLTYTYQLSSVNEFQVGGAIQLASGSLKAGGSPTVYPNPVEAYHNQLNVEFDNALTGRIRYVLYDQKNIMVDQGYKQLDGEDSAQLTFAKALTVGTYYLKVYLPDQSIINRTIVSR
jgi:hypothetical protein